MQDLLELLTRAIGINYEIANKLGPGLCTVLLMRRMRRVVVRTFESTLVSERLSDLKCLWMIEEEPHYSWSKQHDQYYRMVLILCRKQEG